MCLSEELVHRESISPVYWEPYIVRGYRRTNTSFLQCIKYAFILHNDVGNFWTHFIPAVVWLTWLCALSFKLDFTDPYWYPLLALWVGACCYAFCSSAAHFLACKSLMTRQVAYMIDYQGITLYSVGGFIAYYFYERQIGWSLFSFKWTMLCFSVVVCTSATLTCSLSRFFWEKYRYFVRTGSYALPYIMGLFPFNSRFFYCIATGEQCVYETLPLHIMAFSLSLIMVFFFVSKMPERFFPLRFDYFFHSHQVFHISSAGMTTIQLYFVVIDAHIRREYLSADPYLLPDVYSTLVPFLMVFVLGFFIIGVLGYLVFTERLVSNKIRPTKKTK